LVPVILLGLIVGNLQAILYLLLLSVMALVLQWVLKDFRDFRGFRDVLLVMEVVLLELRVVEPVLLY